MICLKIKELKQMMNILHNQWDLGEEESKTTGPWCAYYLLFDILSKAERMIIKK